MAKIVIAELDIDINALLKSTSDLKKEIDALKNTQKDLAASGDKTSEAFVQNEAVLKSLNGAYSSNIKVIQESGKATQTQAAQSDLLSLALDNEATSIAEARQQNQLLNKLRNETNVSTSEGKQQLEALNKRLDENNEFIKNNGDQYLKQKINIGNYKDSIKEAFQEMNIFNGGLGGFIQRSQESGGVTNLLSDSFGKVKESILQTTKAAYGFISTPIGAAVAAIVAIGAGVKEIFDFNKGLIESNKELTALGVNSKELSNVRDELTATAQTFDKDFKDIASKANSLSKAYGISMSEANDIIAQGLATGGAQNSEFLDSLGEYDVFFANAGFSAQEFSNIINTGYDLGIYADKLPDALKEADLALKENTKSTRDALVNAFGASFSDEILTKVSSGQMTTKQAIDKITEASKTANLSQQQYAQLTADVFKGAGEDVGGAQKIFEALGKASTKELDNSAKATLDLANANERLNKAQSALFEVKGFGDIWTKIKSISIDAFSSILEYISNLKKDLQPLIDLVSVVLAGAWENLKFTFTSAFDIISGVVKSFASYFNGIIEFWKKAITGDFQGAFRALADGIGNSFKNIGNIFVSLYNNVIKLVSGIADVAAPLLKTLGVDVDGLKKKIDGLKAQKFEIKGEIKTVSSGAVAADKTQTFGDKVGGATKDAAIADAKAADAAAKKKAADADKAAKDEATKAKELMDAKVNFAKAELNLFLQNNLSKLDSERLLTEELIKEEERRLLEIEKLKLETLAKEKGVDVQKIEEKKLNNEQLTVAEMEYETGRIALANETETTIKNNKKTLDDQTKQQQAEQLVAQKEIDLANAATKFEEDMLNNQFKYEAELTQLTSALEAKKLTQEQYDEKKKQADVKKEELDRLASLNRTTAQLQEFQKVGAGLEGLFGKNKAISSATALINGGLAVTEILKTPSVLPEPIASISRGIQIAGTVATTAKSIAQINGAKFEKGGIQEIGGKRHSAGGTKFYGEDGTRFEAEAGEGIGILNRNAFASFMDFNNAHSSGSSSGGFFAGGGIITQGVKPDSIDFNGIVEAISLLPAPVVAVEEIQSVGNRYASVKSGADL